MIDLGIYIIGYFAAYYIIRKVERNIEGESYNYDNVVKVTLLSLTSWFGVIIGSVILFYTIDNNKKPPKWL